MEKSSFGCPQPEGDPSDDLSRLKQGPRSGEPPPIVQAPSAAPTFWSSHSLSGAVARSTSTILRLDAAAASQTPTGHSFQAVRPLYRRSSMRGWSLA